MAKSSKQKRVRAGDIVYRTHMYHVKRCPQCRELFETRHKHQLTCSRKCTIEKLRGEEGAPDVSVKVRRSTHDMAEKAMKAMEWQGLAHVPMAEAYERLVAAGMKALKIV